MLKSQTAFYKPRIPRLEFKIPTVNSLAFFQTNAGSGITTKLPKTVTTKLPSTASGVYSGYESSELLNNTLELESGNQGLRMAVSGVVGLISGGNSGVIEGIVGSMISSVSNPGQRNTLDKLKPRKTGEIWNEIFSDLTPKMQKWITQEPTLPEDLSDTDKYFDDLISRTKTIAELRNEIDNKFQISLTGNSPEKKSITSAELNESIKRIENMRKLTGNNLNRANAFTGIDASLLTITPPVKSLDGWLYLENTDTLPQLDRSIIKNYSYDKYLEAIA